MTKHQTTGTFFVLTSYGNGTAYELRHLADHKSVFIQGEHATDFRETWELYEEAYPEWDFDKLMSFMWGDYECIATPIEA